ncbi:hypothetical protein [Microvirga tunisiensis]|uniref:hypothetical protein n=1 Tax=Microvirga tunisiensis TaxID=2108360 RepID=UPI00128BDE16|nr:hypothetical protein [Microvirga tunisiensis]MPR11174.1 hypothetical protein [Microvirga tunisiensis]
MAIKDLQNLMWNGAILSGGLSVVARVHAWQAWRRFKAALVDAQTRDTSERLYRRDWDFRYWHGDRAMDGRALDPLLHPVAFFQAALPVIRPVRSDGQAHDLSLARGCALPTWFVPSSVRS